MRAVFRHCWLLNYRMPPDVLAAHLPAQLAPEIHAGEAWLSVVIAAMVDMRPCLAPGFLGVAFDQVVYRAVVHHRGAPGVYFLRTDANHRLYAWGGDLLTHFHFHHSPISLALAGDQATLQVRAEGADLSARLDHAVDPRALTGSAFESVDAIQPALVDRYVAFSVHPRSGRLHRVRVERGGWAVRAVAVADAALPWMASQLPGSRLDSALYAAEIPYVWSALERA